MYKGDTDKVKGVGLMVGGGDPQGRGSERGKW